MWIQLPIPLSLNIFYSKQILPAAKCSFWITGTDVKFDLPKFLLDPPNVLRESLNNRPQLAAVPIPLNPGRGVSLAEDLRTQTDYDEVDKSCSDQKEEMSQWTSFQWPPSLSSMINSIIDLNVTWLYRVKNKHTYCFVWPVDYHTRSFWSDLPICPITMILGVWFWSINL